jgi:hypothetical protein
VPVDISRAFNMGDTIPSLAVSLEAMAAQTVQFNRIRFDLKRVNGMRAVAVGSKGKEGTGLPDAVTGITVGESPTSLLFLHASARRAKNRSSYRLIWDQPDTADLLGWYEVVYEDGFVTTILGRARLCKRLLLQRGPAGSRKPRAAPRYLLCL